MLLDVPSDTHRVFAAQGMRAFAYGLGAVVLGTTLERRGWTGREVALFLGAVLTGTVLANLLVGAYSDRWGRRSTYGGLCLLLAAVGIVLSLTDAPLAMFAVALTGALSPDVIESGPFTTLEQSMLGTRTSGRRLLWGLGIYNAIAAAAGSLGALAAGVAGWAQQASWMPTDRQLFLSFTIAGVGSWAVTRRLSPHVEAHPTADRGAGLTVRVPLDPGRRRQIRRLAALFSIDSFGGGFVAQSYLAYFLADRFDAAAAGVGATFALLGVLSTLSFLVAPVLGSRIGLLQTMVLTHVPSSLFLAAVVFAPSFPVAAACLAGRALLSQMDVPTRQAYLLAIAGPTDRSRAIATTNTARYLTRPAGAVTAGLAASAGAGAPLLVAAAVKISYDAAVWRMFRHVPLAGSEPAT